jgi:hypothetical protein
MASESVALSTVESNVEDLGCPNGNCHVASDIMDCHLQSSFR